MPSAVVSPKPMPSSSLSGAATASLPAKSHEIVPAQPDHELPLGGAVQERVERDDAVDLDGVDVEHVGDHLHGLGVDLVEAPLDIREDRDERASARAELLDQGLDVGS